MFLVLLDFAQNYETVVQNAVQSEFWSKQQITVHPAVVYFKKDDKIECESYAIISEDLNHNTNAVHLFIEKLLNDLKANHSIQKVIYFSDGSAAQYKNKSNFINLIYHKRDFGVEASCQFFATSHGKSPCDGIGGKVKRVAGRANLQRESSKQILTVKALYEWGKNSLENIKMLFCTKKEHDKKTNSLKKRFNKAQAISGTRSFHSFTPTSDNKIICRQNSSSTETFEFEVESTPKRKK